MFLGIAKNNFLKSEIYLIYIFLFTYLQKQYDQKLSLCFEKLFNKYKIKILSDSKRYVKVY